MAEAPAKPESAARRWLTRAALAAPFVLAITGFFLRYQMSHFIMMRRAMADPADEAAHEWIVEHSREPIGDVAKLAATHNADSLPNLFHVSRHRGDVLFSVDQDQMRRFRMLMRSQSETVRQDTLQYLIEFGFPGTPGEFKKALGDRSVDVVLMALYGAPFFRYADDSEWVATVLRLTEHSDDKVRRQAWKTLGESKKAELLPEFLAALEGATPKEASYVLEGMGLLAAPAALPTVRRYLSGDDWLLAVAALGALGHLGTAHDIERLIGMLGEPERAPDGSGPGGQSLHAWIFDTLHELTGRKASESFAEWQTWWEQNRDTYDLDEVVKSALLDQIDQKRCARACYRIRSRNMQHLIPYLRETFPEGERPHFVTSLLVWFGDTRAALSWVDFFETGGDGLERLEALCVLQRATLMDFFTDTEAWRKWLNGRGPNFLHDKDK